MLQRDIWVGGVNPKHTDGYIFALAQEGLVSRMSVAVMGDDRDPSKAQLETRISVTVKGVDRLRERR